MIRILLIVLLLMNLVTVKANAGSSIYRWRDDQGRLHFSDTPNTIPGHHRHRLSQSGWQGSSDERKAARLTRVTLERNQGALMVPVWVNAHHRMSFYLDTGATYSQVTPGDVVALKLETDHLPSVQVQTADGRSLQSQMVTLDSLKIGSFEIRDLEALVGDVRLLGLNALERFRITLDLKRRELTLEPPMP